jgi:hypothetical protein
MFRTFFCPSSGAQWLQWQPLVLPSYRKRQDNKLQNSCIWLVSYLNCVFGILVLLKKNEIQEFFVTKTRIVAFALPPPPQFSTPNVDLTSLSSQRRKIRVEESNISQ